MRLPCRMSDSAKTHHHRPKSPRIAFHHGPSRSMEWNAQCVQLFRPQFSTIASIECAKAAVDGCANKNEVAGGCDTSAETRRSRFYSFSLEFFENAQRHMPSDIAGVHVDRDEFSPRRRITRILRFGIPEPAALRRDFAIRCCIRVIRTAVATAATIATTTTIATTAATAAATTRLVGIDF